MKCLIIAAGQGTRLGGEVPKPLAPLLGVPLLERAILTAEEAGATSFVIVVGYAGDAVCAFLDGLKRRRVLDLTVLALAPPGKENGWSVLSARAHLDEPFLLLLMADHVMAPVLLRDLVGHGLDGSDLVLAVDRNKRPLEDTDVTRVLVHGGLIQAIGKGLDHFNCYDTGAFLCSPALFGALDQALAQGDTSLCGGVRVLAERGRAKALYVERGFWVDVDTPMELRKAESLLLGSLTKPTDGPVSRYVNRRISCPITALLARTSVTPNQVSVVSFLLALVAFGLFLHPSYRALAAAGLLAQLSSILDGTDGELARLKWMGTKFGGWLDSILDRYADGFLLAGLTYHAHLGRPGWSTLLIGFLALAGSFVNTYSAGLFDQTLRGDSACPGTSRFRIGRDVRLFLVFLGAVTGLPLIALVLIAILMNVEVVRRLVLMRTYLSGLEPAGTGGSPP
ncbi:MAG: NTP transferase domain-containing protein [Thermoleophilia bacterium]|nr:NTP transferase domain-containing protein [Thermoleophilia bacterium]